MNEKGSEKVDSRRKGRISDEFRFRAYLRESVRHLVVEGVIGAGKTTLARLLAERLEARLILEQFEDNPFLERFYENPDRWAFHTQLSFLASRFQQQLRLVEGDLFHDLVVSDYTFEKDRIFANVNLSGDELRLYETLYRSMEPGTRTPDLVIYLRATVDKLMENIDRRGRLYEAGMSRSYLDELAEAYDFYFFRYNKGPVLIVNLDEVNFVDNPEAVADLLRQLGSARYRGTIYYRADPPGLFNERP